MPPGDIVCCCTRPQSVVSAVQHHLEVVESPVLLEPLIHCLVAVGKSYKRELQPCFKVRRRTHEKGPLGGGGRRRNSRELCCESLLIKCMLDVMVLCTVLYLNSLSFSAVRGVVGIVEGVVNVHNLCRVCRTWWTSLSGGTLTRHRRTHCWSSFQVRRRRGHSQPSQVI